MSKMCCIPSLRPGQSCRRENKPSRRTVRDQIRYSHVKSQLHIGHIRTPDAPFTHVGTVSSFLGIDGGHKKRVLLSLQRLINNLMRSTAWIIDQQSNPSDESNLQRSGIQIGSCPHFVICGTIQPQLVD
jgi:hypothetical protein